MAQGRTTQRASLILCSIQVAAMGLTIIGLIFFNQAGWTDLALASLIVAILLLLVDGAWLFLLIKKPPENFPAASFKRALIRSHSLVAWLIFHTAIVPLLLLGPRSDTIQLGQFLAFLLAVLIMGLLPVGLIVWLSIYLAKKATELPPAKR